MPRLRAPEHRAGRTGDDDAALPGDLARRQPRPATAALLRVLDEEGRAAAKRCVVDLTPALRQLADVLGEERWRAELGVGGPRRAGRTGRGADQGAGSAGAERGAGRGPGGPPPDPAGGARAARPLRARPVPRPPPAAAHLPRRRLALRRDRRPGAARPRSSPATRIVDPLLGGDADRDAAEAAWRIATSKIADLAGDRDRGRRVIVVLLGRRRRRRAPGGERHVSFGGIEAGGTRWTCAVGDGGAS